MPSGLQMQYSSSLTSLRHLYVWPSYLLPSTSIYLSLPAPQLQCPFHHGKQHRSHWAAHPHDPLREKTSSKREHKMLLQCQVKVQLWHRPVSCASQSLPCATHFEVDKIVLDYMDYYYFDYLSSRSHWNS